MLNYSKKEDLAKQIKEEEEKKLAQHFKSKLSERIQNKKIPKLAKLKEDNSLECMLCKYNCKEEITFAKHLSTPIHKKALQDFQEKYKEKKMKNEQNEKSFEEKKKEEAVEKTIVGVKRPPQTEYKVVEEIEIIEDDNEQIKSEFLEKKKKTEYINEEIKEFSEEVFESNDSSVNIKFENNDYKNPRNIGEVIKNENVEINDEDFYDKMTDTLHKMLEKEDDFSFKIKDNLEKIKKKNSESIKIEKMKIENEDNLENNENKEENKNLKLDLFNWKKRKLF